MNSIKCPFCQNAVAKQYVKSSCEICKTFFRDTDTYCPYFAYYFNFYQINIEIDGILYGLDSSVTEPCTKIYTFGENFNTFELLVKFPVFTPLPEDAKAIKHTIKRIINLKAFI